MNLISYLKKDIKQIVKEIILVARGYIGKEMTDKAVSSKWRMGSGKAFTYDKNTTNRLRNVSGRLYKSFGLNNSETATKIIRDNENGLQIEIGSNVPYARIHDLGGVISNGWGRGIQITIPQRPYFTSGIEKFSDEGFNKIIQEHINKIVNYYNEMK